MIALLLTPPVLSLLVLAAHFLRRGAVLQVALCLAAVAVLFVRRPWVPSVVVTALVLGAFEWVFTMVGLVAAREAQGEPAGRLTAILGGVIAVTVASILVFLTRRVRDHYAPRTPAGERAAPGDGPAA